MKRRIQYTAKVPESEQILMNQFPLLPGDIGVFAGEQTGNFTKGKFTEICFANPEFLEAKEKRLKKKDHPPAAGVIKFNEDSRSDCADFLRNNIRIQYKRSVCVTVALNIGMHEDVTVKLYTYQILDLIKSNQLVITSRDKLK